VKEAYRTCNPRGPRRAHGSGHGCSNLQNRPIPRDPSASEYVGKRIDTFHSLFVGKPRVSKYEVRPDQVVHQQTHEVQWG
jgi:hypothetical protein